MSERSVGVKPGDRYERCPQITRDIETRRGAPLEMSEEEIGDMLEAAKHQMRAERAAKP